MNNRVKQVQFVAQSSVKSGQSIELHAAFNADGTPKTIPGQAVAHANPPALTSAAITGGESPTEAEHNALRADLVALRTDYITLLGQLRTAGVIAT